MFLPLFFRSCLFAFGFLAIFFCLTQTSYSAPAMTGPLCLVRGTIEKVEKRKEHYTPESWRKDWGLPEYTTYTDIYLHLVAIAPLPENLADARPFRRDDPPEACKEEALRLLKNGSPYQLGTDNPSLNLILNPLTPDTCIEAHTQFSGAEFRIGHWINKIKRLEPSACNEPTSKNDFLTNRLSETDQDTE